MDEEEKVLKMFKEVHGSYSDKFTVELVMDEVENTVEGVNLLKHGELCFYTSKANLLFDYVTKKW